MQYRRLGHSGLQLSAFSFGAWVTFGQQVKEKEATAIMSTAYDAGINFFDNAEVYSHGEAEVIMGKVLQKSGWRRDSFAVSGKVMFGSVENPAPMQRGLSRKHIVDGCHGAMQRLQVNYLDLYLCHRYDPEVPMLEIVQAMDDLIRQGKILYWGTSEWPVEHIEAAFNTAESYSLTPPQVEQSKYNLLHRPRIESDLAPFYKKGLGTTVYSPLASGLLTGKYNDGVPADSRWGAQDQQKKRDFLKSVEGQKQLQQVKELAKIARELDASMPQLALAWCLKNPNVSTVILGATRPEQIIENIKALEVLDQLDSGVMGEIQKMLC